MLQRAPPSRVDVLFTRIEREAQNPVCFYRRLLKRAVLQLETTAAAADELRAMVRNLKGRRRDCEAKIQLFEQREMKEFCELAVKRVLHTVLRILLDDISTNKTTNDNGESKNNTNSGGCGDVTKNSEGVFCEDIFGDFCNEDVLLLYDKVISSIFFLKERVAMLTSRVQELKEQARCNKALQPCSVTLGRSCNTQDKMLNSFSVVSNNNNEDGEGCNHHHMGHKNVSSSVFSFSNFTATTNNAITLTDIIGFPNTVLSSSFFSLENAHPVVTTSPTKKKAKKTKIRKIPKTESILTNTSTVSCKNEKLPMASDEVREEINNTFLNVNADDLAGEAELMEYAQWKQSFLEDFISLK